MPRNVKSGLIQLSLPMTEGEGSIQDICEAMYQKHIPYIEEAGRQGVQILCFQEIFNTPYFCPGQDKKWYNSAEPVPGPTVARLQEYAKKYQMVIIAPLYEMEMPGVYYNTAAVIDADGTYLGKYRKMHIPDDPHFYEKFYFTPGDIGFKTFPTQKGKIGTLICWDQWYPEAARLTALQGAEVLFYPTAIGWHPLEKEQYGEKQHGAWMNVMKGHAVANGVYVAAANRIGLEQYLPDTAGIQFWGSSFIAGPQGEILAQASHDQEEILIAEVDLELQENVRQNWPFFRDRRIDAFGDITKRAID